MSRKRTTKALASRIQVDYLKKRLPIRYWKRIVLAFFLLCGASWVVASTFAGKKEIYAPGPVSKAHRLFESDCGACHRDAGDPVPNEACLECHSDRVHRKAQVSEQVPRCSICHVEHRSIDLAASVTPEGCATCHSDLKRQDGGPSKFERKIRRLDEGHPELRFFKEIGKDLTAIKLNHKVHLKPDLEGPDGQKVTLKCGDCHRVDLEHDHDGIYRNKRMAYEDQCGRCHRLGFDRRFPESVVPHEEPEKIRAFLADFYSLHPSETTGMEAIPEERSIPGPSDLIKFAEGRPSASSSEKFLFGKVCLECHDWSYQEGTLPQVPEFEMKGKYLELGLFDHATHRPMACASCHVDVAESEKTADVLVPGIHVCINCHQKGGLASDACQTCHRFHSEGPEKVMEGKFDYYQ